MKKQYKAPAMLVGENDVILTIQAGAQSFNLYTDKIQHGDPILAPEMGENEENENPWNRNWFKF